MHSSSTPSAPTAALDAGLAARFIDSLWDRHIVAELSEYIRIPAKSPAFDAQWAANGFIDAAVRHVTRWIEAQAVSGLRLDIVRLPGRTPLLFFEIAATRAASTQTVLMYGHLDKQPESTGWRADLGPWTPKYENGRLYGRGSADDGYAPYAAIAAVLALQQQNVPHPRIVGLIETSEESGSPDLLPYLDALRDRLGDVALAVCLDSGAGDYERLWLTTSLRGMASGTLKVQVLEAGVHSGDASGLVPSSFRVLRHVLDRLEDSATGRLLPAELHCRIPLERVAQAEQSAAILGDALLQNYPWTRYERDGQPQRVQPMSASGAEALLNPWRPSLSVIAAEGFPAPQDAGNVLRPYTAVRLSLRLPPPVDATHALQAVKHLLERDAPYQARVSFECHGGANGWNAPEATPWYARAIDAASQQCFGAPCAYLGQGGSIPLMRQLQERFTAAQMMICGVLGPHSNAHGPNEFLHVPYAKRLTAAVATVVAAAP
ncbi:MAG: M20/M25/M40 family metallo-hydrolase [Burkholderiaceae bacterium]|jgi:acetylornithine deacetylase/succinyl-diaminopimelate desuccinylase-like protein|nr:M20/M25/M40 family metallo-hydrolase [Burkholderiaceae bacterium]